MTDSQNNRKKKETAKEIHEAMPTGAQVHDALMTPIEEDLTTQNLPTLDGKYAGETPEERVERAGRYKAALARYDAAFEQWVAGVDEKVDAYRLEVLSHAQSKSGEEDASKMIQLESELSDAEDA